ncbi:MAG: hypothetical protein QM765_35980 [Myxococcales bacterium]
MEVPSATHPRWAALISGEYKCQIDFLAAKLLISRLNFAAKLDGITLNQGKAAGELRELYAKNSGLSTVQTDLTRIFK